MREFLALVAIFACSAFASAQNPQLNQQTMAPQDIRAIYPAATAAVNLPALSLVGTPGKPGGYNPSIGLVYSPKFLAVQSITTGSPATCTFHVYGTLLFPVENPVFPTDYSDISGAQTCGTMYYLTYVPASQIVISLTAITGGTSPSVSFRVLSAH